MPRRRVRPCSSSFPAGSRRRRTARPSPSACTWTPTAPGASARRSTPPASSRSRRAFGTGAHPTTRLCVELLAAASRGSLVDVGCGSGVLSIAAARLGYGPLLAIDDDPVAVEVTRANAVANRVELQAAVLDATAGPLPEAHVAVVNILLGAVETVLPRLRSRFAITSGYLAGERPGASGWRRLDGAEFDGWAADLLQQSTI